MIFKQKILLAFILVCTVACSASRDVASVSFRGDCTNFGMKIVSVYFDDGAFLIVTTGARFEYAAGELKIYQGLGGDLNRRLVATLTIEDVGRFEKVEANDDHVLLWSENLNIGIYGDSTCILAPKVKLGIGFKGNFKPDYEGRYKGELLLIDDAGGMEIYPQRYEAGYELKRIELDKKDWVAEYLLNADERVMIAAFPGRHFDWVKSFKSNVAFTAGNDGRNVNQAYGKMPSERLLQRWSTNFDIIVMWYKGLYMDPEPGGPYIVANEPELKRFTTTVHENGMKVAVYCSFIYFAHKNKNLNEFYSQIEALKNKFGIDGVYIDGLTFDVGLHRIDNKIANWEMIRRLRELFGANGVIIFHGTHLGSPVATVPNIDAYCDVTLSGEGVAFNSVNDPYVRYQVRKYGISNNVAMWKPGPHPDSITDKDIIDAILAMNGRERHWVRDVKLTDRYKYYLRRLEDVKKSYLKSRSAP